MTIVIHGGKALVGTVFATLDVVAAPEGIGIGQSPDAQPTLRFDARGLLVLPGIIDVHGDAFERQIMPRPGVHFPLDVAFRETDRQLVANGITTACHGVTWSWEPGLRGGDNARRILEALETMRPQFAADTYFHLRHETFNLDAEAEILEWLASGRIRVLAFNDHMEGIVKATNEKQSKIAKMIERSGLPPADFAALVERTWSRSREVPASIARLAIAARDAGIATMSHDDRHIEDRAWFRSLGCTIAEFPMTQATAKAAIASGEAVVFGAPNVLRGGSHTGCPSAGEMVAKGLCTMLASDYYYPALLQAPFRLASDGAASLEAAWALVSSNPAKALGFTDRGQIAAGMRADLVVVDTAHDRPSVVATIAAGKLVYLADGGRIRQS